MARYKANQSYESSLSRFFKGDEVEMTDEHASFIERDSPGTLTRIGDDEQEAADIGLAHEGKAAVLTELRNQTPTLDLDPEDKANEIPGEGNKFTPASGHMPVEDTVRVVKKGNTAKDRMQRGTGNASPELLDSSFGARVADTSANARVTDETPASAEADSRQMEAPTTGQNAPDAGSSNDDLAEFINGPDDDEDDEAVDSTDGTPSEPEADKPTGTKKKK